MADNYGCETISQHITEVILIQHLAKEQAKPCSTRQQEGMILSITVLIWSLIGIGEIFLLPLDVLKIKRQTNPEAFRGRGLFKIIADEGFALYRGWEWTAARNAPGSFAVIPLPSIYINTSFSGVVHSPRNTCLDWAIITLRHGCRIRSLQWQEQSPPSPSPPRWTLSKLVSRTKTLKTPKRDSRSWGVWLEMKGSRRFSKAWLPRFWRLGQSLSSRMDPLRELG